jgi:hypothetical protein
MNEKRKPQSTTSSDASVWWTILIITHVRSHQDDKRDYADLIQARATQRSDPQRYFMLHSSILAQLDNTRHINVLRTPCPLA